jgi:uncharacterized protein YjbI with pentapeptide repeats
MTISGGSKCSVIKEKSECDASEECVWGQTGKCSAKRKTAPAAAVVAVPSPVRVSSPTKTAKAPKQTKSKPKSKSKTKKAPSEGPAFSWLEKMGQDAGLEPGMSPVTNPKFRAVFVLNALAVQEAGHACARVAGVFLEYNSHEIKAGDFSSQKYYCLALFHVPTTGEFLLIQAWNRIGELPGKNTKIVRASSLEAEFKKVMSDKLKKKYKLAGWDVASPRAEASSPISPISPISPRESEDVQEPAKEAFQPGATLKNVRAQDLKGRNMKGIKILGANMVSADLRGADLSGATLENIRFHRAKLDGANLTGATIRGCGFEDASIKEARFSGARITESDMTKLSSADKAQFNDCILTDVWFSGSQFREANFANAKFEGAETQLRGASFEKANLTGASFGVGIMLTDPGIHDFIGFKGANLQNVKFAFPANLAYNNFEGADLSGVNLEEADLRYCKFKGATMTDANLHMADLRDAELSVAALKNADIDGAIFNTLEFRNGILQFK